MVEIRGISSKNEGISYLRLVIGIFRLQAGDRKLQTVRFTNIGTSLKYSLVDPFPVKYYINSAVNVPASPGLQDSGLE